MIRIVRRVTLVLVLASCGRVYFDPLSDGSVAPGDMRPADARPIDAVPLACSADNLPCANPDFVACGATCFASCLDIVTQPDAAAACDAWGGGGTLARIANASEQTCMEMIANANFIGLQQAAGEPTLAGAWTWRTGEPLTYVNWRIMEPDDLDDTEDGQEQCGLSSAGTWVDTACNDPKTYACSRPAP